MDINIEHQYAPKISNAKISSNSNNIVKIDRVEHASGTYAKLSSTQNDTSNAFQTRNHRPRELEMVYRKLY